MHDVAWLEIADLLSDLGPAPGVARGQARAVVAGRARRAGRRSTRGPARGARGAAAARGRAGLPRPRPGARAARPGQDAEPGMVPVRAMVGYACYADRFAGDARWRPVAHRLPARARRDLPAPDADAPAARGGQRRGLRRRGLPRRARGPGHRRGPARPGRRAARQRHQPGGRPGAQPRGARARLGAGGQGRRRAVPRLLLRLRRPHHARRLRARPCPRCSPTSHPAASPGTTTSPPGSGPRSTPGSGTSTGPTPTSSSSTPRSCSSSPGSGWRSCGWTPSPSSGRSSAPPARTCRRCTRSPPPCARWSGSPRRR